MKRIVIYIILFCSMLGLYTTYTINDFRMIDIKKIETLDEPGIKYVYFGRNTCSLCNEFENNIDHIKIYYLIHCFTLILIIGEK